MTEKQAEAAWAIGDLTEKKGYPPTWKELAEVLGISVSSTASRLMRLRHYGIVSWIDYSQRTLLVNIGKLMKAEEAINE